MRPDPLAAIQRFLERPRIAYIRDVVETYGRAPGGLLANGLAFTALFASIPTMLVALGLVGLLVDDPEVQAELADALASAFPPLSNVIDASLEALRDEAPITSTVGVLSLVWTVSQLYVTLDVAFTRIFTGADERHVVRRTVRGFVWVAIIVALILGAVVAGTLLAAAGTLLPSRSSFASGAMAVVTSWPALIVASVLAVGAIYRLVPARTPTWRDLAVPAVGAGLVIALLSQLFAFIAPRVVGIADILGPLATVFIALAWLSLTFQALLLGAAWVRVADRRRRGLD